MRHPSVRTSARAAVGVLAAATMLPLMGAPAHAEPNSAPVPGNDVVTVYPNGFREVDLLTNDTDPDGDALRVCHIEAAPYRQVILMGMSFLHSIDIDRLPNDVGDILSDLGELSTTTVITGPRATGTKTFTYDVCDRHHVVPATVTVKVLPAPKIKVRKVAGKPGRLRVTNPSSLPIRFEWFRSPLAPTFDGGRTRIAAGSSKTVAVKGPRIRWSATGKKNAFTVEGTVRGIRTR